MDGSARNLEKLTDFWEAAKPPVWEQKNDPEGRSALAAAKERYPRFVEGGRIPFEPRDWVEIEGGRIEQYSPPPDPTPEESGIVFLLLKTGTRGEDEIRVFLRSR